MAVDLSTSAAPPGPSSSVPSGQLSAFLGEPLSFLETVAAEYARPARDVARFHLGPEEVYFFTGLDSIRQVLTAHPRTYRQGPFIEAIGPALMGQGLLTSEGDEHRRQRRMLQPLFQPQNLGHHAAVMAEEIARLDATWTAAAIASPEGQTIRPDLARELTELSLRIVLRSLFGTDLDAARTTHLADAFRYALDWLIDQKGQPIVALGAQYRQVPTVRRFYEARTEIDRMVQELIGRRESEVAAGAPPRNDLLGFLLQARDVEGDGSAVSPREVRDQIVTFVFTGHESTAKALSWIWILLARHPEVQADLTAELDAVLGVAEGRRAPTASDLETLPLTDAVLSEAMRLYPPVPFWMRRRTPEPFEVAGYPVPSTALLLVAPWVTHRDERFWPDPNEFRPAERWTPEEREARSRYAFFPFGAGARQCIGADFAMLEGRLTLALLAGRWRVDLAPGQPPPVPEVRVTLRPRGGLRAILTLRR